MEVARRHGRVQDAYVEDFFQAITAVLPFYPEHEALAERRARYRRGEPADGDCPLRRALSGN